MNNLDYILKNFENKAYIGINNYVNKLKTGRRGILFLISPMSRCNFKCLYCSAYGFTDSSNGKNLEEEKIYRFVNIVVDFKKKYPHAAVGISLHGFEPLQYPFKAFKNIDEIVYSSGYHPLKNKNYIRLSVQTNGYLLDEEKIKFFAERKWNIGFSIDGPKEVHDAFRKTRDGKPTYDKIMENVRLFKRYYGRSPGIISVFTKKHLEIGPEGYYQWLIENDFKSVDIHSTYVPAGDPYASLFYANIDEMIKWFTKLYEIWKDDTSGIALSPFVEFIEAWIYGRGRGRACYLNNGCYRVIELGYDGRFRLCDRWSLTTNKTIDNINRLEDIFEDEAFKKLFMRPFILKSFHPECSDCKYFSRCLGGCPSEAKSKYDGLFGVPIWESSHNCKFIKSMYEIISKDLKERGYGT